MQKGDRVVSLDFIDNVGGYAVPLRKGTKAHEKGWRAKGMNAARSAQNAIELRTSDKNIGIMLHDNVVAIDVDTADDLHYDVMIKALDVLLPSTPYIWGRESRSSSHRAYVIDKTFNPRDHPVLNALNRIDTVRLELRGGPKSRGEVLVLPPSIHPEGGKYVWDADAQPEAKPSPTSLYSILRGLRMAGAASYIASFWHVGTRQTSALALAGFLYRAYEISHALNDDMFKLSYDDAVRLMDVIIDVTGDEEGTARRAAFDATWDKAENGAAVIGARTLGQVFGDEDVAKNLHILLTDSPEITDIDEFLTRFAIWQGPGVIIDKMAVQRGASKPIMNRFSFTNSFAHKKIDVGGKSKLLTEIFWGMEMATRVQGITFTPGAADVIEEREGDKINLWSGYSIAPYSDNVDDNEVDMFLDYVLNIVAADNKAINQWVLAWLADIFQDPTNKPGTALVLVGQEGAGKSWLGHEIIGPIIGERHYTRTNSIEKVTNKFNILFSAKLLIQCDEAIHSGQRQESARMKALITDDSQTVEPKGVDSYTVPAHARYLFTSNEIEDAVYAPAGSKDRRYTILHVNEKRTRELKYWSKFAEWVREPDTLPKIHRWLLDYKYDKMLIRRPMMTEAKRIMQQRHWPIFDAWLAAIVTRMHPLSDVSHQNYYDALDDGPIGKERDIRRDFWPMFVTSSALEADYNYFQQGKVRRPNIMNLQHIQINMKRRGLELEYAKRAKVKQFDPKLGAVKQLRVRMFKFPLMEDIRQYLELTYGFTVGKEDVPEEVVMDVNTIREDF